TDSDDGKPRDGRLGASAAFGTWPARPIEWREFRGVGAGKRHAQHFGFEALAQAGVAELWVHERLEAIAGEFAFALLVKAVEIGQHTLERPLGRGGLAGTPELERNLRLARAVEQRFAKGLGQFPKGGFQAYPIMMGH